MKRIFLGLLVGLSVTIGLGQAQTTDEPPAAPPPPPAQEENPTDIPDPVGPPLAEQPEPASAQPTTPVVHVAPEHLPELLPAVPNTMPPESNEGAAASAGVTASQNENNAAPAEQKVLPLAIVRPIEPPVPEPGPVDAPPAKAASQPPQPAADKVPVAPMEQTPVAPPARQPGKEDGKPPQPAVEKVPVVPVEQTPVAPPAVSPAPATSPTPQTLPAPDSPTNPDPVPPSAPAAATSELADGPPAVALDPCTCDPEPATRFWLDADYLMWWLSKGPLPVPLVTTGSPNDFAPGVLGQPNTVVLMGNQSLNYGMFNGLRLNAGVALDADNRFGIEGSAFWLEHRVVQMRLQGDDNGQPFLAVPFLDVMAGAENAYAISQHFADPALDDGITGRAALTSSTQLESWEANGRYTLLRESGLTFDLLAGYRWLRLSEDLNFSTSSTNITPAGVNEFALVPIPAPYSVATSDSFHTRNQFNGGQVGGRVDWRLGVFSIDVTGKVAVGPMNEVVAISGVTSTNAPLPVNTAAGGLFAQTSNIGVYSRNQFAVVPEARVNFGVDLTQRLRAEVGYTFLYISNVVRPGDQIDRGINTNLVPIDPFYTPGAGPARPAFAFHTMDLWAQGLNLSLSWSY